MKRLRTRLAKILFNLSAWLVPPLEKTEEYKSLPNELKESSDAVVEANVEPPTWHPDQRGNIVVAEPILMTIDRRINKK